MCSGCGRFWTALQVVWSTVYVICGAAQLISGIFFMISVPALQLTCNIWTGSWNVIIGIVGGMLACLGRLSSQRQEFILYMAVSILTVNSINVVLSEWGLYFSDMTVLLKKHHNHMLIDFACFATRIATASVIFVSFLDSQFAFCSMNAAPSKKPKNRVHRSHEQVSDIEYIIPRPKSAKPQTTVTNAYSQSWVFDTENATSSNPIETPYLKILENGTSNPKVLGNGVLTDSAHLIDNPVVHVEEASDDSTSTSDRKLCHMRSFSRSTSPIGGNPPLYDCLENLPSRYKEPEKVQYASLMKELQKVIINKKEVSSSTSPNNSDTDKTQTDQEESSDGDFSKELEAALQLIQDLESPNTVEETSPSKELRPVPSTWRISESDSEKTLSAVGSLAEIASPDLFKSSNGKSSSVIIHHYPDSQSTSGYSSPTYPTPTSWSTTSSLNGSTDMAYSIHSANSGTIISLYANSSINSTPKGKSITLVNIAGPINKDNKDKTNGWNVKSLLRKKKQNTLPKLCPELEGAIIKSESLAYLSELELLARHQRNEKIQREIEEKVIQQLGVPRTESNC